MEARIRERFDASILERASREYGIAGTSLRELDGFENFVYEARIADPSAAQRTGQDIILRISHSSRRSPQLIEGEVDWISFLARNGVSAPRAVPSRSGRLVEAIDDGHGELFLVTAFAKAAGRPPWETELGTDYPQRYGELLGRMHALSKQYVPPPERGRRPHWTNSMFQDVERNLPDSEALAVQRYRETYSPIRTLPINNDSYGLVHYDAHEANLLLDSDGSITIFDFDDCCYSYFIYDIAIVLLHASVPHEHKASFFVHFLPPFLQGYQRANRFDPAWLVQLPHFLKLREIDLYAVIDRDMDVDNLDDWWCKQFMAGRKERIEQGLDWVEMDFTSFGSHL